MLKCIEVVISISMQKMEEEKSLQILQMIVDSSCDSYIK
jgi:hypothetical protein